MSSDYKEICPVEGQQIENEVMEQKRIFQLPETHLFHYTSREVFWKIIEEESLLARHILFSNDYEEYELGREKIKEALNISEIDSVEWEDDTEKYMVCFCEKEDLLSQWRGYAQKGIALEFDFSLGMKGQDDEFSPYHCFTLVNGEADIHYHLGKKSKEAFEKRYVSANREETEKYLTLCVTAPYKVFYVNKSAQNEDLSRALAEINKDDDVGAKGIKLIPYIKNDKFDEEEEYRLIFNLADIYKPEFKYFRREKNIYLDVEGVKKPNIRIEFGDASHQLDEKLIIYYCNAEYAVVLDEFCKEMNKKEIAVDAKLAKSNSLKKNEILLGNGSRQEVVMQSLCEMFLRKGDDFNETKVWCDGHLPIRRIIVGPSKDAELMKKSIIQYKSNKYWMKFIDVATSNIPFRDY